MNKGIIVSTPDLRPSHYSILQGLDDEGILEKVITTLFFSPNSSFLKFMNMIEGVIKVNNIFEKRVIPDFLVNKIECYSHPEILRILANKTNNKVLTHKIWKWSEKRFDKYVAKNYSGKVKCLYGMEHSSLNSFIEQKKYGGLCILRQVIAHPREIAIVLKNEINYEHYISNSYMNLILNELEEDIIHKQKEYELADLIIANSDFVKNSFIKNGVKSEKIISIPTGCPVQSVKKISNKNKNKKIIFLFAGTMSYRKGIHCLINAWGKSDFYKFAELWLAGQNEIVNLGDLQNIKSISYLGKLSSSQLDKVYQKADVFILPTFLEGRSHAVLEALSYGLPVITTEESGCMDMINHLENGFIVERNNIHEIKKSISWFIENYNRINEMSDITIKKSKEWSIERSNEEHIEVIRQFLN